MDANRLLRTGPRLGSLVAAFRVFGRSRWFPAQRVPQNVALLRLPSWLDPWWHIDYDVPCTLSPEAARVALAQRNGRLRGRTAPDGRLVLVRRGGFLNEFVRAQVELTPSGSGTRVRVRVARPQVTSAFFSIALPFLVLGSLVQVIEVALVHRPSTALGWLPFLIIGPAIWAAVIGANYTSARSEAHDLKRLIDEALKGPDLSANAPI